MAAVHCILLDRESALHTFQQVQQALRGIADVFPMYFQSPTFHICTSPSWDVLPYLVSKRFSCDGRGCKVMLSKRSTELLSSLRWLS